MRTAPIRTVAITLLFALTSLTLTSCFLFSEPPITYGVYVALFPTDGLEPFCFGVEIEATFGDHVLMSDSFDQDDLSALAWASEARSSGSQSYYAGMPLRVEVVCRDDAELEIGSSVYAGTLIDPKEGSDFTLWNYEEAAVDMNNCVTPTVASGIQMCGVTSGFKFQ